MTQQTTNTFGTSRRELLLGSAAVVAAATIPMSAPTAAQAPANPTSNHKNTGPYVTTRDGTQIYYKDWGDPSGQPIVFSHGWPLSADAFEDQMMFLAARGYRCAAHE